MRLFSVASTTRYEIVAIGLAAASHAHARATA